MQSQPPGGVIQQHRHCHSRALKLKRWQGSRNRWTTLSWGPPRPYNLVIQLSFARELIERLLLHQQCKYTHKLGQVIIYSPLANFLQWSSTAAWVNILTSDSSISAQHHLVIIMIYFFCHSWQFQSPNCWLDHWPVHPNCSQTIFPLLYKFCLMQRHFKVDFLLQDPI